MLLDSSLARQSDSPEPDAAAPASHPLSRPAPSLRPRPMRGDCNCWPACVRLVLWAMRNNRR